MNHTDWKLWAPRPLRLDEPGWSRIDIDLPPRTWRELEKEARDHSVPLFVYLRFVIYLGLEYEGIYGPVEAT